VHAVVARSTCRSQNTQNTILGALLEVEMFKKCTPLWREAHLKSKALKTDGLGPLFEDVVLRGRRKGFSTLPKVSKT